MSDVSNADATRDPLDELADEFMSALRAGNTPALEPYIARRPDLEADIRELFPAIAAMEQAKFSRTQLGSAVALAAGKAPERIGKFKILRELGRGGMGLVFEALDEPNDRKVALKVLPRAHAANTRGAERMLREARSMAALNDPHVVTVFDAGREGDFFYIVMEMLEGETLEQRVRRTGRCERPELFRLMREMAEGLAVIHKAGLIHRDIKPSNIWIEARRGNVRILDLGLVRSLNGNHTTILTKPGTVVGTPAYMAPEQARCQELDARSDLFSLGSVYYTLCTRTRPFRGDNLMQLLASLAIDDPPRAHKINPRIPEALSNLIAQLMAKNPAERPASADALIERLRQIEKESP